MRRLAREMVAATPWRLCSYRWEWSIAMSTWREKVDTIGHEPHINYRKYLLLSYSALDKSDQGEEEKREGGDQGLSHASTPCCQGQSGSRKYDFTSEELPESPVVLLPL